MPFWIWLLAGALLAGAALCWSAFLETIRARAQVGDMVVISRQLKRLLQGGASREVVHVKANIFAGTSSRLRDTVSEQARRLDADFAARFGNSDSFRYRITT